jgi:metal-responsive CopG/Arc/MetJ family transcriptional regulator
MKSKRKGYSSRSEVIRDAIRTYLSDDRFNRIGVFDGNGGGKGR